MRLGNLTEACTQGVANLLLLARAVLLAIRPFLNRLWFSWGAIASSRETIQLVHLKL